MSRFKRFTTAAVPFISLAAGLAQADAGRYEMTSYTHGAGSEELLAGQYEAAIEAASGRSARSSDDRLIASTNLCVAHTMQGDFDAAREACALALKLARAADVVGGRLPRPSTATAKALSNLGVLNAISGNADAAERNFRTAARIGAWDGASRNLARFAAAGPALPRVARSED